MKHSLFWLLDQYSEIGQSVAHVHEAAIEQAEEADRLGFTSLWLAEHHFSNLGTAANPAVLLAAISQRTDRLRLGPAAAVLPLRNPIHVAEDYALVDALSGGRLNLGVGSGSRESEFAPFGVDFEERRTLNEGNLAEIRKRWKAAASGELGPTSLNVAPVQSPSPPVYVATMNEDTAYQIGLAGDSLLTLVPPVASGLAEPAARVQAHVRGLAIADHIDQRAESIVMMFAHVAETEAEVKATVAPALGRLMLAMSGSPLPDPEVFYEDMRRNGTGVFGTPAAVAHQLQHLLELGIRHVAFASSFGGIPKESATRSLKLLAPERFTSLPPE